MEKLTMGFSYDFSKLINFANNVIYSLENGLDDDNIREGHDEADQLYVQRQKDLYIENSEGGGEWDELAEETQEERDRLGFSPARPILIRLGVLYEAFTRGAAGNYFEITKDKITSGYGGDDKHPGYENEPEAHLMTIADIADIHNNGSFGIPQRILLHEIDEELADAMNLKIYAGLRKMFDLAASSA